ncbi:NlpC/P60 family protein [Paenirhodobacter populi]|uniref:NlpC/P60 family protein n=1 Tax=Paenirhodobacter populi TaxID=2306993 RepID=UPI001F4FDBFD|nr:NlpC/P60 family protein [Sinirhodobacter populi]
MTGTDNGIGLRAVGIARQWIGTPYLHQASVRGVGTDCLGLLRGIWRALYGEEPEAVPPYTADWAEPARQERLWQAAERHLLRAPDGVPAPGQVLLFRMRAGSIAKHLGISAEPAPGHMTFIHAYTGHGVIESPLSTPWQRRIVARFTFPAGA